jgi:hypothetical protein
MPRYFFSCEGAQSFDDQEGTELDGPHEARIQAIENAGEIIRDHAESFSARPRWRMTVSDDQGTALFHLHFSVEQARAEDQPGGGASEVGP